MLVGILTSLPDAIITGAYAPIMITGVVFGAIGGWIVGRWAPGEVSPYDSAGSRRA
jgi:hypothetical protein